MELNTTLKVNYEAIDEPDTDTDFIINETPEYSTWKRIYERTFRDLTLEYLITDSDIKSRLEKYLSNYDSDYPDFIAYFLYMEIMNLKSKINMNQIKS